MSAGTFLTPDVEKIRSAIVAAFAAEPTPDEVEEKAILREAARIWVLNGTGRPGEAATFAALLVRAALRRQLRSASCQRRSGS